MSAQILNSIFCKDITNLIFEFNLPQNGYSKFVKSECNDELEMKFKKYISINTFYILNYHRVLLKNKEESIKKNRLYAILKKDFNSIFKGFRQISYEKSKTQISFIFHKSCTFERKSNETFIRVRTIDNDIYPYAKLINTLYKIYLRHMSSFF
jgi:hypothetical protein